MNLRSASSPDRNSLKLYQFGVKQLICLAFVGIAFLAVVPIFTWITRLDPGWATTTGTVADVEIGDYDHYAIITYRVDGRTYQFIDNTSSKSYGDIGAPQLLAYNISQPSVAKEHESIKGLWPNYVCPIVGIYFIVDGPIEFILARRRQKLITQLLVSGSKLQGVLAGVRRDGYTIVPNGRLFSIYPTNKYRLIVTTNDNAGLQRRYYSDIITGKLAYLLPKLQGNSLPFEVYVNPANLKQNYVDISGLLNMSSEELTRLANGPGNTGFGVATDQNAK